MARLLAGIALALFAATARADLYEAEAAYEKKDLARAFTLYREIAELGHRYAQENVAVMYVNGEGVKRDNALGFAWARIAKEQGGSEPIDGILAQLDPHIKGAARETADALLAQFGQQALKKSLLPIETTAKQDLNSCKMTRPANPDEFYPQGGIAKGIGGEIIVDFTVQPDGRAHSARVVTSTTPILFDEAVRGVVLHSGFEPKRENGVAVPCNMRIKVKFRTFTGEWKDGPDASEIAGKFPATRARAQAGDPQTQYVYAMILLLGLHSNRDAEPVIPMLLKAAQAGVANAQFTLGVLTMAGMSVERDPRKAEIWLGKAAAAGHPQAQLVLANYLVTSRDDAESRAAAAKLLEAAVASNYLAAKYPLAALLATAPEASLRDADRAVVLIRSVMPLVDYEPVPHEVRAAAYAAKGEFEDAIKSQKAALSRARKLGWALAPLEARLANYEAKKPWTGNLIEW